MLRTGLYQINFYKKYGTPDKMHSYMPDKYYIDKFVNEICKKYNILVTHIRFAANKDGYIEFICDKKDALKIYSEVLTRIDFIDNTSFRRANIFYELSVRLKYL